MFTGLAGMFTFRQRTDVRAGLYTSKSDTIKHLLSATFNFFFAFMFESRSIASLSRSAISVHTRANSFHNMSLLLVGLSSNQPPAKKATQRKKESKSGMPKREKKQKMARLLKASSQWPTTRQRAASAIIVHHCIKIAQANQGPSQTDEARLVKSLTQQKREKMILQNSECPC